MTIKPWADRLIDNDVKGATVAMLAEIDDLRTAMHTDQILLEAARASAQRAIDGPMNSGWVRAADDEMIGTHLGVANLSDSYESAKSKINMLIAWHIAVAIDPKVNGGYQLVPIEPTAEMCKAYANSTYADDESMEARNVWQAMTEAARGKTK
jgi:hypothetical protein